MSKVYEKNNVNMLSNLYYNNRSVVMCDVRCVYFGLHLWPTGGLRGLRPHGRRWPEFGCSDARVRTRSGPRQAEIARRAISACNL